MKTGRYSKEKSYVLILIQNLNFNFKILKYF